MVLEICMVLLGISEAVHDANCDNGILDGLICFCLEILSEEKIGVDDRCRVMVFLGLGVNITDKDIGITSENLP